MPTLLTVFGMVMLFAQLLWQMFSFPNVWSQRIFIVLCLATISLGLGWIKTDMGSRLQYALISFCILNIALIMFGGAGMINDATNGTTITEGSGVWMAFDTLSTPFTSKAIEFKIIVQVLIGTVPTLILVFSIISIIMADTPDETQNAILEFIIILGVIILFSFFGNLFGFAWI
jgi:hypothetical protein